MKIDLTNLITNMSDAINIDENINISDEFINKSNIKRLENVKFKGKIIKDFDMNLVLNGVISGCMILPDDITLEDTSYEFESIIEEEIEQTFKIDKNTIDILDYLWQNILVEIPLKVRNPKNENIKLEGNGWRLITEDELKEQKYTPFSDLSKMLEKGGK